MCRKLVLSIGFKIEKKKNTLSLQGVINFNKNKERLNKIWIEQFQGN